MYRRQAYNILESKKNIFHDIEIICLILCLRYVLEDYSFKKIREKRKTSVFHGILTEILS